jgi:hypothetical protein
LEERRTADGIGFCAFFGMSAELVNCAFGSITADIDAYRKGENTEAFAQILCILSFELFGNWSI